MTTDKPHLHDPDRFIHIGPKDYSKTSIAVWQVIQECLKMMKDKSGAKEEELE